MGEQPTFAEQIKLAQSMQQKSKSKSKESQLPSNKKGCSKIQGFRGNCDSQGKLGMCPSLAEPHTIGFPKGIISHETKNTAPRENGLQRPAKGGSTPAFAYQRTAIAPLPCLNLQP